MILKVACLQNRRQIHIWPSNLTEKCCFGRPCCHPKFAIFLAKMCISCLWLLSGIQLMCHRLFHLCWPCARHFFYRNFLLFLRKCSLPKQEAWFSRSCLSILHQKYHFLDHQNDGMRAVFATLLVTTAPFLARFAFFLLLSAILAFRGVAKSSTNMYISCLWAPVGRSFWQFIKTIALSHVQLCDMFVPCSFFSVLWWLCTSSFFKFKVIFSKFVPPLSRKHDFEGCASYTALLHQFSVAPLHK